jgi:predicted dehydrogenase
VTEKTSAATPRHQPTRRDFIAGTATTVAAGAAALSQLGRVPLVHAAGDEMIRVGLIGCGSPRGGRGRGAAENCVRGGPNVQLYAMADLFPDNLQFTRNHLSKTLGDRINVADERCFTGWNAYEQLLKLKEVDVVILATPPGFRPLHLKAAVEAGKHIFAEKPVATDAAGVREVMKSVEEAKRKNLSLVSGLCWRYDTGVRAAYKRVLDGDIGDIVALQCTYNTGELWHVPRTDDMSDVEWQIRNWLYFTWVSGDHITEQHIHSLDKMAWIMKDEPPVRCFGVGGRQKRTGSDFGHIFDHHSVVFEYANGVKLFSQCRQQNGCSGDVSDHVFGTRGVCHTPNGGDTCEITGERAWRFSSGDRKGAPNMYDVEHQEMIAGIRAGKPINNGDYMVRSTMMAIMGRMATYTGKAVTWDFAMKSKEDLMPKKLEFGPMEVAPVAVPGVTPLV